MHPKNNTLHDEALTTIATFIKEVMGEYGSDLPITADTSFSTDLELESIEFVALAEKMQNYYGDHLNFAEWLSEKDIETIISLTVGDVVQFIVRSQETSPEQ